jgi:hypothetical protein
MPPDKEVVNFTILRRFLVSTSCNLPKTSCAEHPNPRRTEFPIFPTKEHRLEIRASYCVKVGTVSRIE